MHELSIADGIITQTAARLTEAGVEPSLARVIRIRVGDLSGVEAETLSECLSMVLPHGPMPNASVDVARVPARMICSECGQVDATGPFRLVCPKCGRPPESIEGGSDVLVESVEVDDDAREAND